MPKKKVYVSDGYVGYMDWLPQEWELTRNRTNANLILFAGGNDISPLLYGIPETKRGSYSPRRDATEKEDYTFARAHNIPMFGTCRGIQFLTAMNGGTLIQHISHWGTHPMRTFDHNVVSVNSLHHQMCNPFNLNKEDYRVIGWCPKDTSSCYVMYGEPEFTVPEDFVEPEALYFPKTKSLGVQWHPEMMYGDRPAVKWLIDVFNDFMSNKLLKRIDNQEPPTEEQEEELTKNSTSVIIQPKGRFEKLNLVRGKAYDFTDI